MSTRNKQVEGFAEGMAGRPEGCLDEHLIYLDRLRVSGDTNMFGARPYLMRRFGLDGSRAAAILGYWMKTFGESSR